jgi:hypothetical protein
MSALEVARWRQRAEAAEARVAELERLLAAVRGMLDPLRALLDHDRMFHVKH